MAEKQKTGIIRGFFGSLVNVKKWVSFDDIVANAKFITSSFKDLYKPEYEMRTQAPSFEEMVRQLQLSEEDIKKRTKYFLYYFIIYAFSALCLFFYMGYLIFVSGRILSVLVAMVLAILMLVYSLREYFWYMQLKMRKVGCGFKDWMNFIFTRAK